MRRGGRSQKTEDATFRLGTDRISRRRFLQWSSVAVGGMASGFGRLPPPPVGRIMTVSGLIDASGLGNTLIHEHILVDFIGAAQYDPGRWDDAAVAAKVLPYLNAVKDAGCSSLVDCTPNYLGRDVLLLKALSERSGLHIVTNTGYYGGSDPKFLPEQAFRETAEQLSARWTQEFENGIEGTGIKPGFMKLSVNPGPLTPISQKLLHAAATTHLKTGLTIASHTGPAVAAFEEIEILRQHGVSPEAFIWVHAQNEKDWKQYVRAAKLGAWVSLDGVSDENMAEYAARLRWMKKESCLHRTLLSHDAGWYEPGKPEGGHFREFTTIFKKLVPLLLNEGILSREEIDVLLKVNPGNALGIRIRT